MAEDVAEIYEKEEKLASILSRIDMVSRILLTIAYIFLISEITGIPVVRLLEVFTRYLQIMPVILKPFRTQILLLMLVVDLVDTMFNSVMIRLLGSRYMIPMLIVGVVLGFLSFCAFPTLLVFSIFFLPKVLAIYIALTSPETLRAVENVHRTGSFE